MKKGTLDIGYQGLIYLTVGGKRNLVPSLLGGERYDYHFPSIDYEYESCYLGFLNEDAPYKNFAEFEENFVKDVLEELKKRYEKARSKEYFDSLEGLALEYQKLKQDYDALKESSSRMDYRLDPAKSYLAFVPAHPEIIADLDIRFSVLGYFLGCQEANENTVGRLTTFKAEPLIPYQSYVDFLDGFYTNKAREIAKNAEDEIRSLKEDYLSLTKDLEGLLSTNKKVGVAYLSLALPKRLLSQEIGSLSELDIDTYLHMKMNRIYWVKRN